MGRIIQLIQPPVVGLRPRRHRFRLLSGILYRRGDATGRPWLVAVPDDLRYDVMRYCHYHPMPGHEGHPCGLALLVVQYDSVRKGLRGMVCVLPDAKDSMTITIRYVGINPTTHVTV